MASSRKVVRTKRFGDFVDARAPRSQPVKRWDGAARTCTEWDNLRRDPELWLRNGNCFIHLYAKGQSRRGPSFKVPLSELLKSKCYPLIERSISWEDIQPENLRDLRSWNQRYPSRRVELYMPPPPLADKTQTFNYHLATRNFFAWVCRRSMVGNTLGDALVGVFHSMHEFRSDVDDNVEDLMEYLDEEGYLDMANQPNHALAILHLAECFQMKELYIRAFAHCVGMNDSLVSSTEYQQLSAESRKAIRRSRLDMNGRLSQTSAMLRTFLDDELSEANLGIPSGARAHLDRFRSFLLSFYTAKLGYYPPQSVDKCCNMFDVGIFKTMREDFEALYDLVVDDKYTVSQSMPSMAYGGLCTIQLLSSFDKRNDYEPLEHPLPLLPETANQRRMSWIPKRDKLSPDRRLTTHAALVKASNPLKPGVSQNELVRAYRRFEEESVVSPNRADRQDKVSLVDARKVRWILIYAVYQVLRSATDVPPEVEQDVDEANYSLAVSTSNIPQWTKQRGKNSLLRRQTDFAKDSKVSHDHEDIVMGDWPSKIVIQPDVDYFAITHKEVTRGRADSAKVLPEAKSSSRSSSLSRALSRSSTLRRSMRLFRSPSAPAARAATPPRRATYHEIVVHGYGNGTNNVSMEAERAEAEPVEIEQEEVEAEEVEQVRSEIGPDFSCWGGWDEMPPLQQAQEDITSSPESMGSSEDTLESPMESPSPTSCYPGDIEIRPLEIKSRRRDVVSMVRPSYLDKRASRRRRINSVFSDCSSYAEDYEQIVKEQRQSIFGFEGALSRSLSRRGMTIPELRRKTFPLDRRSMPPKAQEQDTVEEPYIVADDADWKAMQSFLESENEDTDMVDENIMRTWEQYAELGGLTEMR